MNMKWFGESWDAPICTAAERIEIPVGWFCTYCGETVEAGDQGLRFSNGLNHLECFVRSLVGGINHLTGGCTCCGGSQPPDPPNMTKRAAAKLAADYFRRPKVDHVSSAG